jgi:hypothetical protein
MNQSIPPFRRQLRHPMPLGVPEAQLGIALQAHIAGPGAAALVAFREVVVGGGFEVVEGMLHPRLDATL